MKCVSIIVPVYNAESYLKKCVDSLLAQTYRNTEIVLVDNGSDDDSYAICEKISSKYSNVHSYYYAEKQGPGVARNYGIDRSKGDVIGFCDSDDYMQPNMIEKMMTAIDSGADYVIADMYSERIQADLGLPWENGQIFTNQDVRNTFLPHFIGNQNDDDTTLPVWGSVVRSLFIKDIIKKNHVRFPENYRFAEDLVFTLRYLEHVNSVHVIKEPLYYYRYNETSLMNSHGAYQKEMWSMMRDLLDDIVISLKSIGIYCNVAPRLACTMRSYIHECIGNASKQDQFTRAYLEIKEIVKSDYALHAFRSMDATVIKKQIPYRMIKHHMAFGLTFYYRLRNRL